MDHVLSITWQLISHPILLTEHGPSHLGVILLAVVGTCIAPATLVLALTLLTIQCLYRVLHTVASRVGVVLLAAVHALGLV